MKPTLQDLFKKPIAPSLLAVKGHVTDLQSALTLQKLRREILENIEAATSRENEIIREMEGVVGENNRIAFPGDPLEKNLEFHEKRAKFFNQAAEITVKLPVKITVNSASMLEFVKADHNETLEGIVKIEVAKCPRKTTRTIRR